MNIFLIIIFLVSNQLFAKDPDWTQLYKEMRKGILTQSYGEIPKNLWEDISTYKKEGERWCFVGDSGVPTKAQEMVRNKLVVGEKCDRVFHLGDLVYPVGIKSKNDPALNERFLKYHAPFKIPYYFVLGDHEYYALKVSPWLEVAKTHKNLEFPYYFYAKRFGSVCVVAADTTIYYRGKDGDPRMTEQTAWFKKNVAPKLKGCKKKILIAHHSYATMNNKRRPPKKKYKKLLRDFFEQNILGKFDLIFSGHDHALAYIGNFKGTDQYVTGAGGKYTSPTDTRMDFENHVGHKGPGLIVLDISRFTPFSGIVRVLSLEGDNFDKKRLVFTKNY